MASRTSKTNDPAIVEEPTGVVAEIMRTARDHDKETLAGIQSWEDALALAQETYGDVAAIEDTDLGDGFRRTDEDKKRRLIGVPLFFIEWAFYDGDFGEFVSALIMAKTETGDEKLVLNDGSTGINAQLKELTEKTGRTGGLLVRRGLRVSDYFTDADGMPISKKEYGRLLAAGIPTGKGHTFYLDTSA